MNLFFFCGFLINFCWLTEMELIFFMVFLYPAQDRRSFLLVLIVYFHPPNLILYTRPSFVSVTLTFREVLEFSKHFPSLFYFFLFFSCVSKAFQHLKNLVLFFSLSFRTLFKIVGIKKLFLPKEKIGFADTLFLKHETWACKGWDHFPQQLQCCLEPCWSGWAPGPSCPALLDPRWWAGLKLVTGVGRHLQLLLGRWGSPCVWGPGFCVFHSVTGVFSWICFKSCAGTCQHPVSFVFFCFLFHIHKISEAGARETNHQWWGNIH